MKNGLIAIVMGGALGVFASPVSAKTTVDIYGTYTDSVTNVSGTVTSGPKISTSNKYKSPTISLSGGLKNTKYFNVDNLKMEGAAGYAASDTNGLLFTVDPASCLTSGCKTYGTETADINANFAFYSSTGVELGTLSDTAIATFNYYSNSSKDDDNLCWQNSDVSGVDLNGLNGLKVVSEKLVGTCGLPGSGPPTAYEQIKVDLAGTYYNVNLYDWNDWDEQPKISFQMVPEPDSMALLAASLLGLGLIVARQRRTKAQLI